MDESTMRAFEWASNQNHQSVAARYARTLAEYVKSVGHIELDYPNWQGKFPTIAEAVKRHTSNQDAVIANLRRNIKARTHVLECIANMQITDTTDKSEVLDLCLSMARLEMEKIGAECSDDDTPTDGSNDPHLCVPTLDGNAHVIPTEVFDKIVSGEMKITDMDDWEIITRTAFSEWLRGLETAAKAKVYKAAIDQLTDTVAAGAWQDGPAPKDGSWILGLFHGLPYVVGYDSWEVGGEMLPDGTGSPPDGHESGWCLAGDNLQVMDQDEPEKWARIIHPDRHMPASWDGPGDLG